MNREEFLPGSLDFDWFRIDEKKQWINKKKIMVTTYQSLIRILIVTLSGTIISACNQKENADKSSSVYDQIRGFEMPVVREPVFPDNTVYITDFGAVSDGQTLNTKAFADAISEVSKKGGGRVVIPRGLWFTGPIILKSNIDIHTEAGALVIFSPDKDLYPLIETSFEGYNTVRCISPVYGKDLENIAFTGKGSLMVQVKPGDRLKRKNLQNPSGRNF
jgi:polygalacturonase